MEMPTYNMQWKCAISEIRLALYVKIPGQEIIQFISTIMNKVYANMSIFLLCNARIYFC